MSGSRGSMALAALPVVLVTLMGCSSAMGATTASAVSPGYLFSIPTAAGSLTGRNDGHLELSLTGARDYLTRFTDRQLTSGGGPNALQYDVNFTNPPLP